METSNDAAETAPKTATMIITGGLAETVHAWIESQSEADPIKDAGARRIGILALNACSVKYGKTTRLRIDVTEDNWSAVADALDLARGCDTLHPSACAAAAKHLDKMIADGWPDLRFRGVL